MKKNEFLSIRIDRDLRDRLELRAKKKGVSLSKLVEDELSDIYKLDKEQIFNIISKRKQERPEYWDKLDKSPIAKKFEDFIVMIFTQFVNPISNNPEYQPVVLLGSIHNILKETICYFDSIPEENRRLAADYLIGAVGKDLVEGLIYIKSTNKEIQEEILNMKKDLAEMASYHFTALAFAKDSYNIIKAELEKVRSELIKELKEK